jgi:hypothetical protein
MVFAAFYALRRSRHAPQVVLARHQADRAHLGKPGDPHGHADVIATTTDHRDQLRRAHSDWLSAHPRPYGSADRTTQDLRKVPRQSRTR